MISCYECTFQKACYWKDKVLINGMEHDNPSDLCPIEREDMDRVKILIRRMNAINAVERFARYARAHNARIKSKEALDTGRD